MKLVHLEDPPGTVVVLEHGDGLMAHGFGSRGLVGTREDCELITFTAGPERHLNDVEIYIPKSMAEQIRAAIGKGVTGMIIL